MVYRNTDTNERRIVIQRIVQIICAGCAGIMLSCLRCIQLSFAYKRHDPTPMSTLALGYHTYQHPFALGLHTYQHPLALGHHTYQHPLALGLHTYQLTFSVRPPHLSAYLTPNFFKYSHIPGIGIFQQHQTTRKPPPL